MNYSNFSKNVLSWYNLNKRDLPWRYKGNSKKDPYKIWVSEIMLQQTTVTAVMPYYNKFIKRWTNIKKLSSTNIEDVLDFWSGLGYYRRARNLHLTAGIINKEFNGVFPNKEVLDNEFKTMFLSFVSEEDFTIFKTIKHKIKYN